MGHDYYISGWDISVMPAVRDDVMKRMTGIQGDAMERVVTKLHEPPCPNKSNEIEDNTIIDILHIFWLDFKDFQHKTGNFDKESIWLTNTALLGKSHVWH